MTKLPSNWDIEAELLGSLLQFGRIEDVADRVKPTDFHKPGHQLVYRAIVAMASEGTTPNPTRLIRRLEAAGELDGVDTHGGNLYVRNLPAKAMLPEHMPGLIRDVLRDSRRRAAILEIRALEEKLLTDVDADPAMGLMEATAKIDALTGPRDDDARYLGDHIDTQVAAAFKRAENPGSVSGITTGFVDLDRSMLGWEAGETTVIGGSPGTGKTMFVQDIATHVARTQGGVIMFQMEMTGAQLADRHLISNARLHNERFRRGEIERDEWTRIYDVQETDRPLDIRVDTRAGLTLTMLRNRLRRYLAQSPAKLVIVDFLQMMRASKSKTSEEAAIAENIAGLAETAKECNVHMAVLSQLNRDFHKRSSKRPETGDLRGSGFIEAAANSILMLYRDSLWNEDTPDRDIAEVIIRKQRRGPTETIKLRFDGQHYRYHNLETRRDYPDHWSSRHD